MLYSIACVISSCTRIILIHDELQECRFYLNIPLQPFIILSRHTSIVSLPNEQNNTRYVYLCGDSDICL